MEISREKKAKLNIYVSLLGQCVTLICGLIVPRLLLYAFGSETYGTTASITQFLSYITLLEGGIGGVARAALYKPLADNNSYLISDIVNEIQTFFKGIGVVFIAYVIILAVSYHSFAKVHCLDWFSTFLLVIIISFSTIAQYFIGISYSILIQASQKTYVIYIINSIALIFNTILVAIFINLGFGLIAVKFISSIVFVFKPILTWLYVKKNYEIIKTSKAKDKYLTQKWTGLGQHISYFIHNNTDIVILTIFANLKAVAIYSIYNMVIANMQNVVSSFATGMEAYFGDMIAKEEWTLLKKEFETYNTLISFISCILFSVVFILISSFVDLYTISINDTNYQQPIFAILLILQALIYCWIMPYSKLILAAGHYEQTQFGPYLEAVINLVISMILVRKYGLVGVAIGTVIATTYLYIFYAVYLSKHLLKYPLKYLFKRITVNIFIILACVIPLKLILSYFNINSWLVWIEGGIFSTVVCSIINIIINRVLFKESFDSSLKLISFIRFFRRFLKI